MVDGGATRALGQDKKKKEKKGVEPLRAKRECWYDAKALPSNQEHLETSRTSKHLPNGLRSGKTFDEDGLEVDEEDEESEVGEERRSERGMRIW